jgi:hypothetical protein
MIWLSIALFAISLGIVTWMSRLIDSYDDRTGRRPGACRDGYGSNVSYTWRNVVATAGFVLALGSLFVSMWRY